MGLPLRLASLPGAELVFPLIAPRKVTSAGERVLAWLRKAGVESPRGEELWRHYSSLSDGPTRQAFLRTLRAVVDHRGQAVSALNRLNLRTDFPCWRSGATATPSSRCSTPMPPGRFVPTSGFEVLTDVGHFPHAERPAEVADLIDDFIAATTAETPALKPPRRSALAERLGQHGHDLRLARYDAFEVCPVVLEGDAVGGF